MRGAVSVAMVYYRFDPKNNTEDSHSATIVVTTLQVVLYSTVGMGGVTGPLLQHLLPQQVSSCSFPCSAALPPLRAAVLARLLVESVHMHASETRYRQTLHVCGSGVLQPGESVGEQGQERRVGAGVSS